MYELAYDLMCDSVPKLRLARRYMFDFFLLKYVDIPLKWVSGEKLDLYLVSMQIVLEIVRGMVHGLVYV
jgi:hypothetical protein